MSLTPCLSDTLGIVVYKEQIGHVDKSSFRKNFEECDVWWRVVSWLFESGISVEPRSACSVEVLRYVRSWRKGKCIGLNLKRVKFI